MPLNHQIICHVLNLLLDLLDSYYDWWHSETWVFFFPNCRCTNIHCYYIGQCATNESMTHWWGFLPSPIVTPASTTTNESWRLVGGLPTLSKPLTTPTSTITHESWWLVGCFLSLSNRVACLKNHQQITVTCSWATNPLQLQVCDPCLLNPLHLRCLLQRPLTQRGGDEISRIMREYLLNWQDLDIRFKFTVYYLFSLAVFPLFSFFLSYCTSSGTRLSILKISIVNAANNLNQ